jgi:hypothetical protein
MKGIGLRLGQYAQLGKVAELGTLAAAVTNLA